MQNNMLKKYKVFQEQLIGSKQKLNMKEPEDYNKNIKKLINKQNQVEESYLSEDQPDYNSCTQNKWKIGKLNLGKWD